MPRSSPRATNMASPWCSRTSGTLGTEAMAKILIIGSGGREHALAWRCASEGHRVLASPGSDAIAAIGDCFAVGSGHAEIVALARRERVDLVLVGPEEPLVAGLGD